MKRKFCIIMIFLILAMISVSIVSANAETGYIVRPSENEDPIIITKLSDTITQSETNRHQMSVGNQVDYLEIYHNWQSTSDSLSLTIYTPSWQKIGTFHDLDDDTLDGKIHIDIVPNGNYVEQGTWTFDVYGESVSSRRSYTFNLISH